jgi:hypothetical protein
MEMCERLCVLCVQVYPDKHHGLLGGNTRRHLFNSLDDFLTECFDGVSPKFGFVPDPEDR